MLIRDDRNRSWGIAILIVAISGIVGNVVGVLLGAVLPQGGLHDFLSRSLVIGIDPPFRIDLWMLSLSFGFHLNVNVCCFLFMILGLLLSKNA